MRRFAVVVMLLTLAGSAAGSTIRVPSDVSTLQAAIDSAITDDTVLVSPGTYQENLVIQDKAIALIGEFGADSTVLEPLLPDDHTLLLENTGGVVVFSGFTVQNGGHAETIWIDDNAPATISYCVFRDNLDVIGSNLTVIKCNSPATIAFNLFYNNLGINCIMAYAPSRIINNTIDGNARGIYTDFDGRTSVAINNSITTNTNYGVLGGYDTLAYNNVWGNGEGNTPGENGFSFEPYYVSRTTRDYRLQAASPNIDRAAEQTGFPHVGGAITDIGAVQRRFTPPYTSDLHIVDQNMFFVTEHAFDISWSYSDTLASSQAAYELELWTDSSNWPYYHLLWATGEVYSGDTVVSFPGDSLHDSRIYRLRARVNNGSVWGEWRESIFRINTPPPAPTPRLPYNTEVIGREFARLSVTLVNDLEDDSLLYFYEMYTDEALTEFVEAGSLVVSRNDTLARSDTLSVFTDDAEVWWRARAFDGHEYSNWCPTRRFTLRVNPHRFTVPGDFGSINDAVEYAIDGDTIDIEPGIYRENIEIIDKAVVLRGTGGRDVTFLEPLNSNQPILVGDGDKVNTTEISGFTFRYGNKGGVHLQNCRVRFENNEIHDCTTPEDGGGLYLENMSGVVSGNLFHHDSAGRWGGAVYIKYPSWGTADSLDILYNQLWGNYANRGAAMSSSNASGASRIYHNLFYDNTGADSAGAYHSYSSNIRFGHNTLVHNDDAYRCQGNQGWIGNNIFAWNREEAIIFSTPHIYTQNCLYFENGNVTEHDIRKGLHEDPLFVDTANLDFHLQLSSPCINAGYTRGTYADPDSTRSDIGAYPYDLSLPIATDLTFHDFTAERMLSHNPKLSWEYFDTLASTWEAYEMQVGESRDPFVPSLWNTGEILSWDTALVYAGAALLDGHDYVYRVRLRSNLDTGDWIYKDLHMNLEPEAPVPVTPINNQTVSAAAVQLRVDSVPNFESDIITYDFKIYESPTSSLPVDSILGHPEPMSPDFVGLTAGHQYWWKARAYDGYEFGPWTTLQPFQTQSGATVVEIPDDYTSIQAAINVLSSGDTIKLSPGIYTAPIGSDLQFYNKRIVVTSTAGAQWTTIDLNSTKASPNRLLVSNYQSDQPPVFLDLTITGGDADSGGVVWNSDVRFEKCVIIGNTASYGAVAYGSDGRVEMYETVVENNSADELGGVFYRSRVSAEGSRFKSNTAGHGGVSANCAGTFVGSTLEGNSASTGSCSYDDDLDFAYCLLIDNGPGSVTRFGWNTFDHCTIARNTGTISVLDFWDWNTVKFTSCLIADNTQYVNHCEPDPDWNYYPGVASAYYCNIYNNRANYSGCLGDDAARVGNISLDPMFCDPDNNNFHLQAGSPCLGTGENGTDIGAFGSGCIPTDVDDPADNGLPGSYALAQNYPNPFNPSTLIAFDLPKQSAVRLEVFNVLGQRVRVLTDQTLPAGTHEVVWDGTNAGGSAVSSGVYFYRLSTEDWSRSRKMLLLK